MLVVLFITLNAIKVFEFLDTIEEEKNYRFQNVLIA
jgi:hypothetical protein